MALNTTTMINSFRDQYFFLSNFYPCNVDINGATYPSSEHAFMSHKSGDLAWKLKCQDKKLTCAEIKRLGRRVKLVSNWEDIKLDVMYQVVRAKFIQNAELMAELLATGNNTLVEGNWWGDVYWGVCNGVGENNLGKILMRVRSELNV